MFSAFQTFGKLGAIGKAIAAAWSPLSLWPDGISSAGMWISPRDLTSEWADYTGTTPVVTPGTVADSSNPVGLALDLRAGATVLTDPGNHMLQSTSVDRPLLSARVNLLTYTEDFSNGVWGVQGATKTTGILAPDGTNTAVRITTTSNGGINFSYEFLAQPLLERSGSAVVRGTAGQQVFFGVDDAAPQTLVTFTGDWQEVTNTQTSSGDLYFNFEIYNRAGGAHLPNVTFDVWHPQLNLGSTALPYQSIPGNGSTYASGPPIAQLYNGTNSSMATAAFSAGTLIDGMDCMIAVRRDSAADLALMSDAANEVFGVCVAGAAYQNVSGAGTPTVWVDGVQLAGGVYVTAGTLDAALTVGNWHIVEFRGLDLSLWESIGFSNYIGLRLNGPRGDIFLYPSTASTEDKDAARQWLADYYGVTLP